jgi:D-alanine-D-alanine ligase
MAGVSPRVTWPDASFSGSDGREEKSMNIGRIGVLMGGSSAEREVSLKTGAAVSLALEEAGHDVARIELGKGADWVDAIRNAKIDVAFLALHGRLGEDGCIQGLLEVLGIPYTGSSVMASAVAMDKLKSKELFRLHNVPTPPYYVFDRALADIEEVHGSFGFPVVAKPRREGSSFGISKAQNPAELARAIEAAQRYDRSVLVERFIKGKEISVGILNGRVLGAIEIAPKTGMYDYHSKYTPGMTEYFMPARLEPTRYRGVLNLAERAAEALDTTGAVRVDVLVTEGQNEYVLEVNTLPGMTPTSLLPKIANAAGYGFGDLCVAIVETALSATAAAEPETQVASVTEVEIPAEVAIAV